MLLGASRPYTARAARGLFEPPLLETTTLQFIEFFDRFGDRNALLANTAGKWKLITRNDETWSRLPGGRLENSQPGTLRFYDATQVIVDTGVREVEFYNGYGDLSSLLFRLFSDDVWGYVTTEDKDWHATLVRLGYATPSVTFKEILKK